VTCTVNSTCTIDEPCDCMDCDNDSACTDCEDDGICYAPSELCTCPDCIGVEGCP
jgi:hypothetical protein